MAKLLKNLKFPSELRLDLVSQDWVVIATGRARRPETFKKEGGQKEETSIENCPFCNIESQAKPVLAYCKGEEAPLDKGIPENWTTIIVPNKYPAFLPSPDLNETEEGGIYKKMNAVGFHEVLVTRDHKKQMAQFSVEETKEVFDAYQKRYLCLMGEKFVNHISIFHNHGREAGASIAHPHSQIITTPLIDVDLRGSIIRAKEYYEKEKDCIYCRMNRWEAENRKRIIFENKEFTAVCPFASKTAFEVIVSPKKHLSKFEEITDEEKWQLAEAFQSVLSKISKALNEPPYNFYLHSAPCDGKDHSYYHWHWTILPKTSIWAGFEIGARMEISIIEPEKAAEYLREQ